MLNIATFPARLAALSGFQKYATAFIFGLLTALAMPPIGAFYLLLVSVPGMIWLTQNSLTKKEAFLTGWSFGAGYFISSLYWISIALFVDIQSFWWVLPLSLIAGPAALALYYGFIPLLAWRYKGHATAYTLMFVTGWALIEWVRGHALTGFPWNLPGYAWHYSLPVMQTNAAIGIYGLSLLTLLWATLPALSCTPHKKFVPFIIISFLLAATAGGVRLYLHPSQPSDHYTVRIIQPNIPQSLKWDREAETRNFQQHINLTTAPSALKDPLTFIIWPETAVTSSLQQYPELAQYIRAKMPQHSTALLGNLHMTRDVTGERFYNSLVVLNKETGIQDIYSKHHLVPFGEYIPFRHILNMTPIAAGIAMVGDFTPGDGVSTLHLNNLPKPSPLICYEVIFPGAVARRDDRPDWLVNITNDGWYGKSAGPYQHFEIARARAIEEGLPLVRAANTGISATIDPLGRIVGMQPLGTSGIVDTFLPRALSSTIYSRVGDTLFFLMIILLVIAGETLRLRKTN